MTWAARVVWAGAGNWNSPDSGDTFVDDCLNYSCPYAPFAIMLRLYHIKRFCGIIRIRYEENFVFGRIGGCLFVFGVCACVCGWR